MDKNATKPNGGSMEVIENSEDVQKRIEEAGYSFKLEAMETEFTEERISESTATSSDTSSSNGTKKAGDYTKAGAVATIAFTPIIPAIAEGPKVKLRDSKSKNKVTEKSAEDKALDEK